MSFWNRLPFHLHDLRDLDVTLTHLIQAKLWIQVLVGMGLGIGLGFFLSPSFDFVSRETADLVANWVAVPGYLFLVLVQMVVIPLIIASIIRGIASGGSFSAVKQIGVRAVVYFLLTTTVAVFLGVGLTNMIKPGDYLDRNLIPTEQVEQQKEVDFKPLDWQSLPQSLTSVIPANPGEAIVNKELFQIVIFSIIFGLALVSLPKFDSEPLLRWFGSLQGVCLQIVNWAMVLAPFAVFGLMAQIVAQTGLEVLLGVGVYMGVVLLGLLLLLVLYLMVVATFGGMNPFVFLREIRELQLLAFSTSSSAAVMPLSLKVAEEKLDTDPSVASLIVPLGTTINMDGTALYQSVAAVFLAQVFGVDLNFGEIIMVVVTIVGASIGTPAVPGVGVIILGTILGSVGVPLEGIALIIGTNRILDMFRTSINVTGDMVACRVIGKWVEKKSLVQKMFDR